MTQVAKIAETLPAVQEATALENAAQEDAAFDKMLKFKKGEYFIGEEEVKLGTQYIAHAVGYTKCWIKFVDQQVAEKRHYRASMGQVPVQRDELDDNDPKKWPIGISGGPSDPWVLQSLLPLENSLGELVVFVTSSWGGKRAVADLVKSYALRTKRTGNSEQPVIKLNKSSFPSKKFGNVACPVFEICGWDSNREGVREVHAPDTLRDEMADEIPF